MAAPLERAMNLHDDMIGDDPERLAAADEFERRSHAMHRYADNYIEEHDLTESLISHVPLEPLRQVSHDRSKKDADHFIGEIKLARATNESQIDQKPDDSGGGEL
jgi:hypothetical protein